MMENLSYIQFVIGNRRTLVITCLECCLDIEEQGKGNAFRYTSLANALNPDDKHQQEAIFNFVEFKNCSQVIIAGHYNCHALDYILNGLPEGSSIKNVQPQLIQLRKDNHAQFVSHQVSKRLMVELNVIHQCRQLLKLFDFEKRIEAGSLNVVGIVIDQAIKSNKQIFYNGLSYNNLITVN